jgi:hypothetical protein
LVFDEVEILRFGGLESDHNLKVVNPLQDYKEWFEAGGLAVKSETPLRKDVEEFFTRQSPIRDKIEAHWGGDTDELLSEHLSIEFVDYVLEHPSPSHHKVF